MIIRYTTALCGAALILALVGCKRGADLTGHMQSGHTYYVFVKHLSVLPNKPGGQTWDSDSGAPDLMYTLTWQGMVVYKSAIAENALDAEWNPVAGGQDTPSTINAGLVRYDTDAPSTLRIDVNDGDLLLTNEPIASFEVNLSSLKVGDNSIDTGQSLVSQLTLRVVDADASAEDLRRDLQAASAR